MRKLAARGPGPHSVYRKGVFDTMGEGKGNKTLKASIHENDFQKKTSPHPEGGRGSKLVLFNLVGIYNEW